MTTAAKPSPTDDLDVGTTEEDLRKFLATEADGSDFLAFQLKASVALVALLRRVLALEAELSTKRATV